MYKPLLFVFLLAVQPAAHAQPRHVHGEGRLDVTIDKGTLTLNLELPLDAAVGFERAPKTDKETLAHAGAEKTLKDAAALFVPTAAAQCVPSKIEVGMPAFGNGEHADIDAEYVFTCSDPATLKEIETTLFKSFKRLYRLEVQRTGPTGQGAARLTPKKPVLSW